MNWDKAFDKMLADHGISAKKLAQQSGVSEITISRFRRGRQPMSTETLDALLMAVSAEARSYFFEILAGQQPKKCPTLQDIILEAEVDQLAKALQIISARFNKIIKDPSVLQDVNLKTRDKVLI